MMKRITARGLIDACADSGFDSGIRIEAELEPQAGLRAPVKPAVYEGGRYQQDRRWPSEAAPSPVEVVVIDNVPSQANRLEAALQVERETLGLPELVLDLSDLKLPVHLPRRLSSFQFPHRNADAYLRDSEFEGQDFRKTEIGKAIEDATPATAGPLLSWFPQALLFGFWQSHLGKKRQKTKHARAWSSEIVGWEPAATTTRTMGLKGDALNLVNDVYVTSNEDDRSGWTVSEERAAGTSYDRLSEIGHGQVPFMNENDSAPAGISFARITQQATVSFSQLRRVSLGDGRPDADACVRAVVVALGLVAHSRAFDRGFSLRSGADLRVKSRSVTWLGPFAGDDAEVELPDFAGATSLLSECVEDARRVGVGLEGWASEPLVLTPKSNLRHAIVKTWPELAG